jgi:glyoxylase-like metal-dependent hydrolase (beta-lactamase superfamily II)
LPVPYPVGGVNAWLLAGDPLTLVDAGARWPEGMRGLEQGLAAHALRVEDVELLVLTHHHDDHAGLAADVQARSGCRVAAHAATAARLGNVPARRVFEDAFHEDILRRNGAPPEIVATVAAATARATAWQASVAVDEVLHDGDILVAGGRRLEVLLRPGHSQSDTLLLGPGAWAIVGDHLLARAHSVALLESTPPSGPRPRVLPRYREELAATAALGLGRAFAGHGEVIEDASELAGRRVAALDERASGVLADLGPEPVTAWDLLAARGPWRDVPGEAHPVSMHFVLLGELLGLLDLLLERGAVEEHDDGRLVRYSAC